MVWKDTVASRCRYGDDAEELFGAGDVIWESSEDDYQGFANVFVSLPDGRFAHYEWSYGSCSGCDEWESRELNHDAIVGEMRDAAAWLPDIEAAKRYLRLEGEYAGAKVPTANDPTNGSIPGMLRVLTHAAGSDFLAIREAFSKWLGAKERA